MKLDGASKAALPGQFVHNEWPYEPRFRRVNGWRMHYIDEGAGDPVVLLHGNPAWGFLYRKFVKPLTAAGRRVIVPDMVGFGLSEKPVREQAHSLDGHIANLTGLLRQLDVRNATVVCHDWGGSDRSWLCTFKFQPRPCARDHEHLGVAASRGPVPQADISVAHDARAPRRPIPSWPAQAT